ncbi:hypothetical protein BKH42_05890 [Helicobacter sp. 13S00482-2]|uniref:DUF535 family protein n=1 Tax=Helicobacter sp. 13S00482-2 TaxID=1476200 RepID=UPI000BA5E96D|nr:DUF535 family protein [Helicobacter sp. 13S00482-2]PAF53454.1 hypothetical protein BKH42_05890 [Helicobacter sp. 13S00482-2]
MQYKFFGPSCLKDSKSKVTISRYVRYYLRKIIFYPYVKKFEKFVNADLFFIDFFQKYPVADYVVIKRFCNKNFNATQRYNHVISDLSFMQRLYSKTGTCLWKKRVEVWSIKNEDEILYKLFLEKNIETSEEGFWALVLRDKGETRIYQATFTITPDNNFLIASVQGSRESGANEEMKVLTKKLFGLRPSSFLIEVLKILTRAFGCNQTLGISPSLQIRSTKGLKKGFYADYDRIWLESYGELITVSGHHYYCLAHKQKSIEEVSSNKRLMYKRRFEMLRQIEDVCNEKFKNSLVLTIK